MKEYPIIHVFGQYAHHGEVFIAGNIEGIRQLLYACVLALQEPGETANGPVYVNDGEGYDLHVIVDPRLQMYNGKYAVPYTADYATETREDAIYPWIK